jgi:molybdenum cofactor cytidylyltransferase
VTFEWVAVADALGAILAHSVLLPDRVIQKGTILTADTIAAMERGDVTHIYVARLDPGDMAESEAAERIARRIAGENLTVGAPTNGRVDLFAAKNGVVSVDRDAIDRVNLAQSAIQLSTLPEFAAAESGQIVATVKVIPFGVDSDAVGRAEVALPAPAVALSPLNPLKVGVIATETPLVKQSVLDKTRRVLEERLRPAGAHVVSEKRLPHDAATIGEGLVGLHQSGAELLIIFGASATSDGADVVPRGIEMAGGRVLRIGMPVDPGNLLVLGELDGVPVIGAPGCARSPAPSGFDWVLRRVLAGIHVSAEDLARMGVGGVLAERRTQRVFAGDPVSVRRRVDAIILAAGSSSRMNGHHKLLARINGTPLVRLVAEAALASAAASVTLVVGHRASDVAAAVSDLDVTIVENPNHRSGLSSSLRTGVAALGEETDAAIILLADMPDVGSDTIDTVIDAFDPELGRHVVVPTFEGKAGNPVLWSRRFFPELMALEGDKGAREMIRANADAVAWVKAGPSVTHDIDTPEAMAAIGGSWA